MNNEALTKEDWAMIHLALIEARNRYLSVTPLPVLVADKAGKELMEAAQDMFRIENKVLNYLEACDEEVTDKQ